MSIETVSRHPEGFPIGPIFGLAGYGLLGGMAGWLATYAYTIPKIENGQMTEVQANHIIFQGIKIGCGLGVGIRVIVEILSLLTK